MKNPVTALLMAAVGWYQRNISPGSPEVVDIAPAAPSMRWKP